MEKDKYTRAEIRQWFQEWDLIAKEIWDRVRGGVLLVTGVLCLTWGVRGINSYHVAEVATWAERCVPYGKLRGIETSMVGDECVGKHNSNIVRITLHTEYHLWGPSNGVEPGTVLVLNSVGEYRPLRQ